MGKARYDAVRIATELGYGKDVIIRLKLARTETEILNILVDARRNAQ